jgi:hypothetical protein
LERYKQTVMSLSHPLPPIARSFAEAAEAVRLPYIGQKKGPELRSRRKREGGGREGEEQTGGGRGERDGGEEGGAGCSGRRLVTKAGESESESESESEEGGREGGREGGGEGERERGKGGRRRRLPLPRQLEQVFDEAFPTAAHTVELWQKCSVVVGMHPDEATEPIVDLCLRSGKAFAIVPCCVYPDMNRHRKLADGSQVRTWEQFLCYLQAKDTGIMRTNLPFPGRNVVLFHMGRTGVRGGG